MVPDHFSYLLINSIKQSKMFALSLEIALYCSIMAKSRFSAFLVENVYVPSVAPAYERTAVQHNITEILAGPLQWTVLFCDWLKEVQMV